MWWVWLMCVWGVAAGSRDPLLHALQAAGRAPAALCVPGAACAGVLWARHWLLVRASCVHRRRLAPARLLLHAEPNFCKYVVKTDLNWPGPVMARFLHPRYHPPPRAEAAGWGAATPHPAPEPRGQFDAALVLLAEPAAVPTTANHSRAYAAIPPSLVFWLRSTMAAYPGTWDQLPQLEPGIYLASSPMRLLVLTVLLPTAALLVLCMLLLRYTAAPAAEGAYDMLDDDDMLGDEFPREIEGELRTVV